MNNKVVEYFAPNVKVDKTKDQLRQSRNEQILSAYAPLDVVTDIDVNWLYSSIILFPLPDLHAGNINARLDLLDTWVKTVRDTYNSAVILNGDIFDNATQTSVSNTHDENLPPEEIVDYLYNKFLPLAKQGKIVAVTPGNHDSKDSKRGVDTNVSVLKILANRLQVPFVEHNALITFNMPIEGSTQKGKFVVAAMHGAGKGGGTAKSLDVMKSQIDRVFTKCHVDLAITGHTHPPKGAITSVRYEEPIKDRYNRTIGSTTKEKVLMVCPTLQADSDYAAAVNMGQAHPNAFMAVVKMKPNPYYKTNEHENNKFIPKIAPMEMFKEDGTLCLNAQMVLANYYLDSAKIEKEVTQENKTSTLVELVTKANNGGMNR